MSTGPILEEIAIERTRQIAVHEWDPDHDDRHTRTDWSWLLSIRTAEMLDPVVDDERFRRLLIETAAIAAAAIEAHDRRGGRTLR